MKRHEQALALILVTAVIGALVVFPSVEQVACLRTGSAHLRWLTIGGEAGIFIAYMWIPARLILIWRRLRVRPHASLLMLYGAFIVLCGFTHAMGILMFWLPVYWLAAKLKVITAGVSLAVAYVTDREQAALVGLGEQGAALAAKTAEAEAASNALATKNAELVAALEAQQAQAADLQAERDAARRATEEATRQAGEARVAREELIRTNAELESARAREASRAAMEASRADVLGTRNEDLEAMIRRLQAQDEALRTMEAPIMEAFERVLLTCLVGTLSSDRAADWRDRLTERVHAAQAHVVVIDVTGLRYVDTAVAGAILSTTRTLALLGARPILTGIRPEVAQALVGLGVDVGDLVTLGTLRQGLELAARPRKQAPS